MRENRNEQRDTQRDQEATILVAESLRNAAASPEPVTPPAKKEEDRVPIFWRIFGSTMLSIMALVIITLYQQLNTQLDLLRNGLSQLSTSCDNLVKKDEFNSRVADFNGRSLTLLNSIKELQAANAAILALKERSNLLEHQMKAGENERKDMARELRQLREQLVTLEGRRQPVSAGQAPR
jgi:hypothetical protein